MTQQTETVRPLIQFLWPLVSITGTVRKPLADPAAKPCASCGVPADIFHHVSYLFNKGVFLCLACHAEAHSLGRTEAPVEVLWLPAAKFTPRDTRYDARRVFAIRRGQKIEPRSPWSGRNSGGGWLRVEEALTIESLRSAGNEAAVDAYISRIGERLHRATPGNPTGRNQFSTTPGGR